jgi:DNA repair photolyase
MNTFTENRDGKGTKEWSDVSYNICSGCEHGCLYCYAWSQRCRFDASVQQPGVWQKQKINPERSLLGAEVKPAGNNGQPGVVMFPTSHDITPGFVRQGLKTIRNLLGRNRVLIVSKPHLSVVRRLCRELSAYKADILFRFTIGSLDKALCAFWEPGAPPPQERLASLKHAFRAGYATSVSCEPMLAGKEGAIQLVAAVEEWVTDSIWIGKMQRIPQKYNAHIPQFQAAVGRLKAHQIDAEILELVEALKHNPKVRWKDSIRKAVARNEAGRCEQ